MRVTRLSSSALMILLPLAGAASAQAPKKTPVPYESRINLKGFRMKGGVVNVVEGPATCACRAQEARRLRARQELENGDTLRTGRGARAEILLVPGYYLRLSGDTEVTLLDLASDNLKLRVSKGSAIVEVSVNSSKGHMGYFPEEALRGIYDLVTVVTPSGELALTRGGAYRIDVSEGDASELKVLKGEAVVAGKKVEGGEAAKVRGASAEVWKPRVGAEDDFDAWSRGRAARLVGANKSAGRTAWYKHLRNTPRSYFFIDDPERPGQMKELYTVSALGGLVGFADEGTAYKRGDAAWQTLKEGEALTYGDVVRTGEAGRAEILLYPDCFLHLSAGSEATYLEGAGGGVLVKLLKGSAVVGSKLGKGSEGLVTLSADGARYEIVKRGVYRLNVAHGGGSELLVYEGAARFEGGEIKEGRKGSARGPERSVTPIDKGSRDGFDVWSERRGTLTIAENKFARGLLLTFKLRRHHNVGLWYLEETSGEYTFIPGRWSFRSPYGGDYSVKFGGWRSYLTRAPAAFW